MLSEIKPFAKGQILLRFHLHEVHRKGKFIKADSSCLGLKGRGKRSCCLLGTVQVWDDEKFWRWRVVMAAKQCGCT